MNTRTEVKARRIDPRDIAVQSHQEAAGLTGMPGIDRKHFDPHQPAGPVAESPGTVVGRPAVIVPET